MSDLDLADAGAIALKDLCDSTGLMEDDTFYFYSQEELENIQDHNGNLIISVVYEGMTPVNGRGNGLGVKAVYSVIVGGEFKAEDATQRANKSKITAALKLLRNTIKGKKGPGGHFWVFEGEYPMDISSESLFYVQRWGTVGILT